MKTRYRFAESTAPDKLNPFNHPIISVATQIRVRLLVCAAAIVFAIAPTALAAAPPAPALNEWCPVMTEEKADPEITTVYRGKTVAFCCDRCLKKFRANPAKYASRLPQFADPAPAATNGHEASGEQEHTDGSGNDAHQDGGSAEQPKDSDESEHDHVSNTSDASGDDREPLLGRVHPILVHFPLAGIPLALLGFLVWVKTGKEAFARADVPPLLVAALAAIASVITGNIAHDSMRFSESLLIIVDRHQLVSTTVMVLVLVLCVIRIWRWNRLEGRWRWVYGWGLLVACGLLGYTGFLGGSLVFGPDHLAW